MLGYEGDFSWTSIDGTEPSTSAPFQHEVREPWLMTNRARLGYALTNWLIYATGGAATASLKVTDTDPTVPVSASETATLWGWTAGGGVEYAFTGNWSAKLEYLYVQLPSRTFLNPNPLGSAFDVNGFREQIVRVGLNYKFWTP